MFRSSIILFCPDWSVWLQVRAACRRRPPPAEWADHELAAVEETPLWPFWPAKMRIHPSRITTDANANGNQMVIETRLEFTDTDGLDRLGRRSGPI
jgi:hypothetical protein